eukprot:939716-Prorocentrum_minimum.AAC.1
MTQLLQAHQQTFAQQTAIFAKQGLAPQTAPSPLVTPPQATQVSTLHISPEVQSQSQTGICQQGFYVLRHQVDRITDEMTLADLMSANDKMGTTLWTSPHGRHNTSGRPLGGPPRPTTRPAMTPSSSTQEEVLP